MGKIGGMMRRTFRLSAILIIAGLSALGIRSLSQEKQISAEKKANSLLAYKDCIDRTISPEKIDKHLRFFTAEPHVASTPRNNELAKFIFEEWKSYGLEDVHISGYDVLLSFPERIMVEVVSPKKSRLNLKEETYKQDSDTQKDVGIPYNAYSRSAEITAPLVYANSGNPQDFDYLEKKGIKLQGKIALVRYSAPYSYRGFKALTAEKRGLAGLLIYSDPKEDGFVRGPVFPDGPWGPMSHIQRGGIPFDFIYPGDPLTPGWASLPGAKRLSPEESVTLPKIISIPLSAQDALPLFKAMGGEKAPEEWKGALPITYHLGGESPLVHIDIKMDNSTKRISNVIGSIKGSEEPEEILLVGNHRDAWVFGGVDPSSGTACLMELARAFGEAKKAGFVPRRSVYFASWDAEEFTLTGSTEWGEENRDWLKKNLVAYINVDSSAAGQNFNVSAVPSLSHVILSSLQEVADPATGKTVYERWKEGPKEKGTIAIAGGGAEINPIGSGSDHTVFLNHICAPALDMTFSGDYGVYHSMYDDYYWMTHFGDPGMKYTAALAKIWAHQVIDLASSRLLPLDFEAYAAELKVYLEEWAKQFDPSRKKVEKLFGLIEEMRKNAAKLSPQIFGGPGSVTEIPQEKISEANRNLLGIERDFSLPEGIPNRNWFKHLIFGTRSTYAALLLPELQEAAEAGNEKGVAVAIAHLERALSRVISKLKDIADILSQRS
jgi:N-acetylated-alpha-linked acidic dipeptidase